MKLFLFAIIAYYLFDKNMILVFTGDGKGKTTAAVGTVLRAVQKGKRVVLVQLFKGGDSGEIKYLKESKQHNLSIYSFGGQYFVDPKKIKKEDRLAAKDALKKIDEEVKGRPFMIVFDEAFAGLTFGLISEIELLKVIKLCRQYHIHLILTGRGATDNLLEEADLVTKMKNMKHPYDEGKKALAGVDF